ncbi:MAG: hypothetical protein C4343_00850 [Chloroflexota bacterium]
MGRCLDRGDGGGPGGRPDPADRRLSGGPDRRWGLRPPDPRLRPGSGPCRRRPRLFGDPVSGSGRRADRRAADPRPLSERANLGEQAFVTAFVTLGTSSILSAVNFLVTVAGLRAPGLTLSRLPIFVWSLVVTASIALLATSVVAAALTMVMSHLARNR